METYDSTKSNSRIKVWDIWIRLFHWSFAMSVLFLLVSGVTGWRFYEWHSLVGEIVLALLLFRLLWGLVGSSNALLFPLLVNPLKVSVHLKALAKGQVYPDRGHNVAGGIAVLIILGVVGFQAFSGLFIADRDEMLEGRFYSMLSSELSRELLQLHYLFATIIQIAVVIHVLMVLFYMIHLSHNLITPMMTGWMHWPASVPIPKVLFRTWWLGFVLAASSILAIGFLLSWW
ncbi:cytochrome b/b6 domain-containing protein [Agarilytica rhodophyticola]|uniref:cytochrome b/b6 domain-containing protein n=1 Tax=Agarilytica rhodophyticola TaxID=1737490 RepID=UPI0013155CBC|nr:cytochrome b/b6 domain-containing protein [Agarilytica rhodophyticola]